MRSISWTVSINEGDGTFTRVEVEAVNRSEARRVAADARGRKALPAGSIVTPADFVNAHR
jgi:hypothetical protein